MTACSLSFFLLLFTFPCLSSILLPPPTPNSPAVQPPHRLSGPDDPYASSSYLPHINQEPITRGGYSSMAAGTGYNIMDNGAAYAGSSQWLEKQQASSRKSKIIVSSSCLFSQRGLASRQDTP